MQHNKFAPVSLALALHFVLLHDLAQAADDDDDREAMRLLSGVIGYIDGFYDAALSPII
jgi:hypothetical protein